jgi:hypothetical protein
MCQRSVSYRHLARCQLPFVQCAGRGWVKEEGATYARRGARRQAARTGCGCYSPLWQLEKSRVRIERRDADVQGFHLLRAGMIMMQSRGSCRRRAAGMAAMGLVGQRLMSKAVPDSRAGTRPDLDVGGHNKDGRWAVGAVRVGGRGGYAGLEMVMRPRAATVLSIVALLGWWTRPADRLGECGKPLRHVACSPFACTATLDVARPMNRYR